MVVIKSPLCSLFNLTRSVIYILRFDGLFRSANDNGSLEAGLMCYGWLIFHNNAEIAHGHGGFTESFRKAPAFRHGDIRNADAKRQNKCLYYTGDRCIIST